MFRTLKQFVTDESGATMIEYGLIAALVSIGAIALLSQIGTDLSAIFTKVQTQTGAAGGTTTTTP